MSWRRKPTPSSINAMPPSLPMSRSCLPRSTRRARPTSWSITPAPARAGPSSISTRPRSPNRSRSRPIGGFLVAQAAVKRMLPRRPRRHPVHRRLGEREGLCAVGALRHGQVRAARAGAKHGARTGAAGHPCRAFRHRRRHPQRAPPGAARQAGFAARSRRHRGRAICTCCSSRAAPGRRRSSCGPGWRSSDLTRL